MKMPGARFDEYWWGIFWVGFALFSLIVMGSIMAYASSEQTSNRRHQIDIAKIEACQKATDVTVCLNSVKP